MDIDATAVRELITMQDEDGDLEATHTERLIKALDVCYPSEETRDN